MSQRWLHLRLSAPLMAFGGVAIDHVGPTRDFPSASALTGLFANALGWQRTQGAAHQSLQDRLEFGALIAQQGRLLTDTQNAKLEGNDRGWTSWGRPDERAGATYDSPHRRRRDYLADHDCRVVLRLSPGEGPDLDQLPQHWNGLRGPCLSGASPVCPQRRCSRAGSRALTPVLHLQPSACPVGRYGRKPTTLQVMTLPICATGSAGCTTGAAGSAQGICHES